MQVGVTEEDMTRVFRLGKRPDSDNPGIASRPIMVHFASYGIKNLVMESLYKLKDVDKKFKGINMHMIWQWTKDWKADIYSPA